MLADEAAGTEKGAVQVSMCAGTCLPRSCVSPRGVLGLMERQTDAFQTLGNNDVSSGKFRFCYHNTACPLEAARPGRGPQLPIKSEAHSLQAQRVAAKTDPARDSIPGNETPPTLEGCY